VIASPGIGKTTAITERISNLVHSDLPVKNFMAVTYTERAAKKIKERVYSKILMDKATSESTLKNFDVFFLERSMDFARNFYVNITKKFI
jgi:superfamily I DNA/RNA helicase